MKRALFYDYNEIIVVANYKKLALIMKMAVQRRDMDQPVPAQLPAPEIYELYSHCQELCQLEFWHLTGC